MLSIQDFKSFCQHLTERKEQHNTSNFWIQCIKLATSGNFLTFFQPPVAKTRLYYTILQKGLQNRN